MIVSGSTLALYMNMPTTSLDLDRLTFVIGSQFFPKVYSPSISTSSMNSPRVNSPRTCLFLW